MFHVYLRIQKKINSYGRMKSMFILFHFSNAFVLNIIENIQKSMITGNYDSSLILVGRKIWTNCLSMSATTNNITICLMSIHNFLFLKRVFIFNICTSQTHQKWKVVFVFSRITDTDSIGAIRLQLKYISYFENEYIFDDFSYINFL